MTPGFSSDGFPAPGVREAVREAIGAAAGSEVFFLGRAEARVVCAVEDVCRGNARAVPALRRLARGYDAAIAAIEMANLYRKLQG